MVEPVVAWKTERRREGGRGEARDKIPFKGKLPVTYFLHPGPTSQKFLCIITTSRD
jgi:hypothetical protein